MAEISSTAAAFAPFRGQSHTYFTGNQVCGDRAVRQLAVRRRSDAQNERQAVTRKLRVASGSGIAEKGRPKAPRQCHHQLTEMNLSSLDGISWQHCLRRSWPSLLRYSLPGSPR